MRVWTTLLILTITSGCAGNQLTLPLCLPDRPVLEPVTIIEQMAIRDISKDLLRRVSLNDLYLKAWLTTVEGITEAHNEQFEAECP